MVHRIFRRCQTPTQKEIVHEPTQTHHIRAGATTSQEPPAVASTAAALLGIYSPLQCALPALWKRLL